MAKFITSGRVICHAFPVLEDITEEVSRGVGTNAYVGNGVTEFLSRMAVWGAVGAYVGFNASFLHDRYAGPLEYYAERSPLIKQFKHAARSAVTNTRRILLEKYMTPLRQYLKSSPLIKQFGHAARVTVMNAALLKMTPNKGRVNLAFAGKTQRAIVLPCRPSTCASCLSADMSYAA